jgi:hypothetical protein
LTGVEESSFGLILGHRPNSSKEFLIGSHSPPLIAISGPSVFNVGHRVGASCEFSLGGPFDHRDVVVPPVVGWKRQRMVEIYNFFNNILCSVIA